MITTKNYGSRDDHKDHYEWLLSLNEQEKKIAKNDEVFKIQSQKIYEEAERYGLFSIMRNEDSTVENTLRLLEEHFNL